ncbi:hypothetical protein Q4I28_001678 [Leishmania naiffi]|uniref:Uncharacterized protein n=1 Tax=Leishmania naiffi TaxID=5678 RepID=A0AAW3C4A0_9TRYP
MTSAAPPDTAVAAMRLEPLRFAGYEQLDSGDGGFVHLITPQGGRVRLYPSRPSFLVALPPLLPQPPASRHLAYPPSPLLPQPLGCKPTQKVATPAAALAEARQGLKDVAMPHASTAAAVPLAPPEGFEVEFSFLSSEESSAELSRATSRGASPPPQPAEAAATETECVDHAPTDTADTGGGEPTMLDDTTGELEGRALEENFIPHTFVHGTELTASATSLAELDDELTKCALILFDGRIPQSPPLLGQAEAPPRWSEAVNYHRAVLLGYDDAGFAYIDAQAFAQRVSPPQGWRLLPLPLLVCVAARLSHFYRDAELEGRASEQSTDPGISGSALRYPVLPTPARTTTAGGSEEFESGWLSRNSSTRATVFPPPYPSPASGEPPVSMSSGITPPASSLTSLTYLSPPLRWSLPTCGHAPMLDLEELFQVQPSRVYQLAQPPGEAVFLGVALGVPWIRPVVLATATPSSVSSSSPVAERGGAMPHETAPLTSSPGSQPPAGYRWKDMFAWAVPLVGCHDASEIRTRHGLIDPTPAATDVLPTAAVADTQRAATPPVPPSAVVDAVLEGSKQAPSPQTNEADDKSSRTSAPQSPPPQSPSPKPLTAAAPFFVKEGTTVFVPGRFGVMLECNTKPALMVTHFGVAHGDRLVPRALSTHPAAAQLSGTPKPGEAPTPPLPSGSLTVMGLHGRNALVLLADGEGQTAELIHITRGAAEVAEAFRKVAGAPLSPPALPLEPLSVPAFPLESPIITDSAAAVHLMVEDEDSQERPQRLEKERWDGEAAPMPRAATWVSAEETDAVIAPSSIPAAEVPLNMYEAAETQGTEEVREEVATATPVVDGAWNGVPPPIKAVMPASRSEAGEGGAPSSLDRILDIWQAAPTSAASARHACQWSSATSPELQALPQSQHQREQQSLSKQNAEAKGNNSDPSTARVDPSSTLTEEVAVQATEVCPTSAEQLVDSAEELTVVSVVTPTTSGAPPLMTVSAANHTTTSPSGEVVIEAKAVSFVVEAASTSTPSEKDVLLHNPEVVSAGARLHENLDLQLPEKEHSVRDDEMGLHLKHDGSLLAQALSSNHTPSVRLTPSSSMTQPPKWHPADDVLEKSLAAEEHFNNDGADVCRLHAAQTSDHEERNQHSSGAHAGDDSASDAAFHLPSLLAPPQQQGWVSEARSPLHSAISANEEVATTTATTQSLELSSAVMPRSHYAKEAVVGDAARQTPPSPLLAHPAMTFASSCSPPPAGTAACQAASRAEAEQVTSYPALATPPCSTAFGMQHYSTAKSSEAVTAAIPTPFTNFLKAYGIFVLSTHGARSGGEGRQLPNETSPHMGEHAAQTGEPSWSRVELSSILSFYRAHPLARIMEATAIQRRCRAAWRAAITSRPTSAAPQAVNDLQVCKLKASASTTVFEELRVNELVSLLSIIVHHPLPERERTVPG